MDFKDYYKILGVEKTASSDEIKKSFRNLAKKYHPDKNPGDKISEEKFKEASEAYEILSDPEKRKKYDRVGSNWKYYQNAEAGQEDWFANFSQRNRSNTNSGQDFGNIFGNMGGFSDFFEAFMGGAFDNRSGNSKSRGFSGKGADYEANLNITLEEAFNGSERTFTIDGRTIKIKINPGTENATKLRLKNQGAESKSGGERGDLYLTLNIIDHPDYELKGNDIYHNLRIDLYTAILGGKKQIKTIDGKSVNITIPKECDNDKLLRIKSMGMKFAGSERGDLFIRIKVDTPKNLTEKELDLFKKLAEMRKR